MRRGRRHRIINILAGLSVPTISFSSGVFSVDSGNANDLEPIVTDAYITGTLQEDEVLTAVVTAESRSPFTISSYTYQWYRSDDKDSTNRAAISGATNSTYTLVTADVGKFIDFVVTAVQSGGTNTSSDPYTSRKTTSAVTALPGATSIIVNLRRNADTAGEPKAPDTAINELTHTITSISAGSVVDSQGNTIAGIGLSITSAGGLPGLPDGNLTGNTTRFSDASLDTHINTLKGTNETMTVSGLSDAGTYTIEFMGTTTAGTTGLNRIGVITAGGASGTQKTTATYDTYNQTATVSLTGLTTDGAGNLLIIFEATGTAGSNNWLPMSSIAIDYE